MKLAISGKGGTGKTTISASLAHFFAGDGYKVYTIDADPDANLASMLGITEEVKPLAELKEVIADKVGGQNGIFTLNPDVSDVLKDYTVDHKGLKFIQMGRVKRANSSCYCPENSFLRAVIDTLVFNREEVVIMDMGAGIEHLTRGTSRGVDLMLIACEPTNISLETAEVIKNLALESGISRVIFVGNKIRTEEEKEFMKESLPDEEVIFIDYDIQLLKSGREASRETVVLDVDDLYEKIISEREEI